MAYSQHYTAYKETGIKTASQGKLIIMLYEGAVRQLNSALSWIDENGKIEAASIEKFHNNIVKTQEIITELMVSLNMEQGGDIAQNLMALYRYFNRELMDIIITHDRSKVSSIVNLLSELHGSWSIAVNNPIATEPRTSLDING